MKYLIYCTLSAFVLNIACRKTDPPAESPIPVPQPKILLKTITRPGLPSPYYHFTYGNDSLVTDVSFASGFNMYKVFYENGRIAEMRNDIIVNHDTLRYLYDVQGKIREINFIDEAGLHYRRVDFMFTGEKLTMISWFHLRPAGFDLERTIAISYLPDGNAKEIIEHRPALGGQPPITLITTYSDYDNKVNVDDFSLLHDGIHDHLFLIPGNLIQKNNHAKEIRSGNGLHYTGTYNTTYKADGTPLSRTGTFLITSGPQTGQGFQSRTDYVYY
jgi:hypothetical protein